MRRAMTCVYWEPKSRMTICSFIGNEGEVSARLREILREKKNSGLASGRLQDKIVTIRKLLPPRNLRGFLCPGGTFENSPTFQRWEEAPNAEALGYCHPVPPGRDSRGVSKLDATKHR